MILVLDTETTGLLLHPKAPLEKQPKIIELGMVLLDAATGQEVDSFCEFINPSERITAEITKITGITDADVAGAWTFASLLPRIKQFMIRAERVCAHNLPFDKGMIENEARRCGVSLDDLGWPKKEFCTVSMFTPDWGRMPKLTELYEAKLGKPLAQTHRALDDVRALVEIIQVEKLYEIV